ncbi:hypothetical protein [Bacillus sp. FJAT-53711]|uniref:hypothetical protein n=1 Tax=Bacillus yunxiaonensis TaxID=3127665 RepID=UPI00301418EC
MFFAAINSEGIIEYIKNGEAKEVYDQFLQYIITRLVNIAHILNSELIIRGRITELGETFLKQIQGRYQQTYTKEKLTELHNDTGGMELVNWQWSHGRKKSR